MGSEKTLEGDSAAEPVRAGAHRPAVVLPKDFAILLGLPPLTAIAWLVPPSGWPAVTRTVGRLALSRRRDDLVADIQATAAPPPSAAEAARLAGRLGAEQIQAHLTVLRCHRPGGWRPRVAVEGRGHLDAALAEGRGAVLWVSNTVHCDLPVKLAFHQAGLPLDHLSRRSHGFSGSWLGRTFLNRIHTSLEDACLRARVLLDDDDPGAVLRELERRLADNRLVSVTVHRYAKRPAHPAFLRGRLNLAPGAPIVAFRAGAPLLPVFAFREADGVVRARVEAPLDLAQAAGVSDAVERAARLYAERLEPYVRRHPEQWRGWLHL